MQRPLLIAIACFLAAALSVGISGSAHAGTLPPLYRPSHHNTRAPQAPLLISYREQMSTWRAVTTSPAAQSPWPMFRHNPRHTGRNPFTGPTNPGLQWSFTTEDYVWSSPAIGADGGVYVASEDGKLYAFTSDGTPRWTYASNSNLLSSPAVDADGVVYVGALDGNLYAINPDGKLHWAFPTGGAIYSSPVIGADGAIYIGSNDGKLYAVKPGGTAYWSFNTGDEVRSSPAVDADGNIYVGSGNGNLYAIDPTGEQRWVYATGAAIFSSPAIAEDDTIYIGSNDGKLHAINSDGKQQWVFATNDWIWGAPAVGADGTIYVGSDDGMLYAIDPDGKQRWVFTTGDWVDSSPAVAADGTVYVGSFDGSIYAITPDGKQQWAFPVGGAIYSSPAIAANGVVYVGANDGAIYAIGQEAFIPTPTITPNGGTFPEPVEVTLACPSVGAAIRYTTNGTEPTEQSARYEQPLTLNKSATVKAKAFKAGMTPSGMASANFTIPTPVATPTLTPGGGTFTAPVAVAMACATPDATIRYTTDGTEPTEQSPRYEQPVTVNTTTLVKAKAFKTAMAASPTATGSFFIPTSAWPMFRQNPQHTGRSPFTGPTAPLERWTFTTGGYAQSSPALGADNTIYLGSQDGNLYAIKPNGTLRWAYATGDWVVSSPAVGKDGTIYVGSYDGKLYAVTAGGALSWACAVGSSVYASPVIGADGTIYVSSIDGQLYAITTGGAQQWVFAMEGASYSSPAIGTDGTLYVGADDGRLYAVNADGTPRWAYAIDSCVQSSPAIGADGTIYVGAQDGNLYAIKPDGTLRWAYATGSSIISSPALGADGMVYVGASDNKLYAIKPDGTLRWAFATGDGIVASPAVGADGTIYVGSYDRSLYAVTPGGAQRWAFATGEAISSSPALGADGVLYIAADDGKLYAIGQQPAAATPTITPNGGTFANAVAVTLACATEGAQIHYTTDGTEPTEQSALYTRPLALDKSATLKANAFKAGLAPSMVASANFTIQQYCTGVTLAVAPTTGVAVTITATPKAGEQVEYEFWRRDLNGSWTKARGFAAGTSLAWIPTAPGNYLWVVYARDLADPKPKNYYADASYAVTRVPFSAVTLAAPSAAGARTGQPVSVTATAQGGTDMRYEFWLRDPAGVWTRVQGFKPTAILTWTPTVAGAYQWVVYARDAADTTAPTRCAVLDCTVQAGVFTGVTLVADPPVSAPTGAPIAVTAQPVGGLAIRYEFWLRDPNGVWTKPQGWRDRATFPWQPTVAGNYQWAVYAREANDPTVPTRCAVLNYTVVDLSVHDVTLTTTPAGSATLGAPVQIIAAAQGGANVRYEFWLRDPNGVWAKIQGYQPNATRTWQPTVAGSYQWVVYALDAGQPLNPKNCAVKEILITK